MVIKYLILLVLISKTWLATGQNHRVPQSEVSGMGWRATGQANWSMEGGQIQATQGKGFLVSQDTYENFELTVQFRPGAETNSGIFVRCQDPDAIDDKSCYEINIFDHRPDPSGRTGGIVHVAAPLVSINTEQTWNTYQISAQGDHLVVKLNGVVTVDTYDSRFSNGVIALQLASGSIQFRDFEIIRGFDKADAIKGIWKLTRFDLIDARGNAQPWCEGSHGTIMYTHKYMSVSINCASNTEKKVFYSGPYEFIDGTVVHNVSNFSDLSLHQEFRRSVDMPSQNKLNLVGPFGEGGKVVVGWERLTLATKP